MLPAMCPTVNTLSTVPEAAIASFRSAFDAAPTEACHAPVGAGAASSAVAGAARRVGGAAVGAVPWREGGVAGFITEPS